MAFKIARLIVLIYYITRENAFLIISVFIATQ